ncbi:MAG: UvrD-helicase domain-containing protein, partial [Candidatus Methylomirabilis sp.]|nr:UvrD-helicase domain-containing protein [Deltaproteobacteria bacterium]
MKPDLNPPQREAALHGEGPLLILAGAGSGKTRVLTYRIARLIEEGLAEPREILALTFTNKAAKEMAERVSALLGGRAPTWITTFHSACVRILRREADRIGWPKTFVILDDQDQIALLKRCLKLLELDDKRFPPKALRDRINAARNDLREPGPSSPYFAQQEKQIFDLYEARKKESGALDFGDLIAKTVLLFEKNPDVLKRYADQFRWIVVDEYQDTNHAQYRLLQLLTQERKNLCVVGDDDQSIYRWRGADLSNILNFERDNPGCKVVKLEENYRSTQNVLAAANAIVQTISGRKPKTLWTKRHHGSPIYLYVGEDERDEAAFVAGRLSVYAEDGKLSECAVFYRANAQSRVAEEELARRGIPYKVLGGTRFYDRAEIKDALAYLRIVLNPRDDVSALRIVNTPARGLGDKTLAQADETMRIERCGALDALGFMAARGQLSGKAEASARALLASHARWREKMAALPLGELFQTVLEESGYLKMLEEEGTDQALGRLENLEELRAAAEEFQGRWDAGALEREPGATALSAFLD